VERAQAVTTLGLANKMRSGEEPFSPHRLWFEAQKEGADYQEAMIHAGAVGPKTDGPFKAFDVCPKCGADLGPVKASRFPWEGL
jgi:hypothetical protein